MNSKHDTHSKIQAVLLVLIFLTAYEGLFSQKEYHNWDYCGQTGCSIYHDSLVNVVSFDTPDGEPKKLRTTFIQVIAGSSTISSSNGKLLFASNGVYIYNYLDFPRLMTDKFNNSKISNATNTRNFPSTSSTQGVLWVKKPQSDSLYYLFYNNYYKTNDQNFPKRNVEYAVVDISSNNQKGQIISMNNEILPYNHPELMEINNKIHSDNKLIGIRHDNGIDIWIIFPIYFFNKDHYILYMCTYLLTREGLSEPKIINTHMKSFGDVGQMKANIDGNLIAMVHSHDNELSFFSFNNNTGELDSILHMNHAILYSPYGIEFSPQNNKLYILSHGGLFQIDISKIDLYGIRAHTLKINDFKQGFVSNLQLAPNGKIYFLSYVIENPNSDAKEVILRESEVLKVCINPPNVLHGAYRFEVKISTETVCEGDTLIMRAVPVPDFTSNTYSWEAPDGKIYTGKVLRIPNAQKSDEGLYKLTMELNSTIVHDSVYVLIKDAPIAKISGDTIICSGETTLFAEKSDSYSYLWSTGETTDNISVNNEGTYILTVTNDNGCKATDSVYVTYKDDLTFSILAPDYICLGDTIVLKTSLTGEGYKYDWSTGEKTAEIVVTRGGEYFVTVVSDAGCTGAETITIEEFEKPEISFEKYLYELCEGESLTLRPLEINAENSYKWNDGLNASERIISESGEYFLVATSPNGCTDTAFAKVEVYEMPQAEILASSLSACFGEEIILTANNFNPEFIYVWSTGETSESITVSTSGKYKLKITNNICTDSTEINVTIYPDMELELVASPLSICNDEPVIISSKSKYEKYFWSTGESSETITVTQAGLYSLRVENEAGCTDSATIEILKNNISLIPSKESLDFGEICLGTKVTEKLRLTVQTDSDLSISEISFQNNNFTIENVNSYLRTYSSGEVIELSINYVPQNIADFTDILLIKSDSPCEFTIEIPLSASSKMDFVFSLPVMKVESGASIAIPLNARLACPDWQSITTDYEITVAFDAEYFYPDSVQFGQIVNNTRLGSDRIITIKAPEAEFTPQNKIINYIYGKALVGRSEATPLKIISITLSEPKYYFETINGELTVEGCVNDLSGVQMFKPTALTVAPNPARDEITLSISTQEQGNFRIEIYDIHGKIVHKDDFKRSANVLEIIEFSVNTKSIGNGSYTIQLITPWNKLSEQVMIMK
jgi:hypothetical protein